MFKQLLGKRIVLLVIPVLLAGAGFFLLGGAGAAPFVLNIVINQPAEGNSAKPKDYHLTVSLGERVVNLADPGGYRYLKAEIVVEVAVDQKTYERLTAGSGGGGHGGGGSNTDPLHAELAHSWPKIQDALTLVLTSKTVDDVSTPEGKERLKAELAQKLQPAFGDYKISEVYLTQFVIQ